MTIQRKAAGHTKDGAALVLYTLKNTQGMSVTVTNYGGTVTSIQTPDKTGALGEVVLGFDHVSGYTSEAYLKNQPYFGAIIGRFGNRIKHGKFSLDGKEYTLATNNGENHLHGGNRGFDKVIWQVEELAEQNALRLTYESPDGEEGYPGTLRAVVTYTLTEDNELRIQYSATADKPTPVNLTNHSYFNLSPGQARDAREHLLMLNADRYVVVSASLIPTGELRETAGTAMDFQEPTAIGARIEQVEGGYDHTYVLKNADGSLQLAATVLEPLSGRRLDVFTTEPGVQFYSGNFLDGSLTGHGGIAYQKHYGFCLETQHFPDAPNQTGFASVILRPGEEYFQQTIYRFSAQTAGQQS